MKRKLSNVSEKKPMLRKGFFNPVPKNPVTTWESLREKMHHIWEAGEKGFIDDMPLEVLVRIFARHNNVPDLCLVNKFFLGLTRAGAFRESFLYLNACPIAYEFECYHIIVPSLFNNLQLSDVVNDPILWERLLRSKGNSIFDKHLFGTGSVVYANQYTCSHSHVNGTLYEGEWMNDLSEYGLKIPHGLGTCFTESRFAISGTWDSGVFRTGKIYYDSKVCIDIEKSSITSHRTESLHGMVCDGSVLWGPIVDAIVPNDDNDEIPVSFKGIWLYSRAFDIEAHFCNYFTKTKFVKGVLTFKDEIHTGCFIENMLDSGTIETISTGVIEVVTRGTADETVNGTVSLTTSMYVRRNAMRRRHMFQGRAFDLMGLFRRRNDGIQ